MSTRSSYSRQCDVSSNPDYWVFLNRTSHQYEALASSTHSTSNIFSTQTNELPQDLMDRNDTYRVNRNNTYRGRLCDCSPIPDMYCPEEAVLCKVTARADDFSDPHIICMEPHDSYQSYLLAMALFFLLGILVLLTRTVHGQNLLRCLRRAVHRCCGNGQAYRESLEADLERIDRQLTFRRTDALIQRRALRLRWDGIHNPLGGRPVAVTAIYPKSATQCRLKTKVYRGAGETCAICLLEMEPGDRVGDLPCDHWYHIDFLKDWLKRKNMCPLCKAEDIASVCFEAPTVAEGDSIRTVSTDSNA